MPNLIRALGFSLLIMLSPHLFAAPERLALVIGNAAYAKPLKNPGNDADAMTAALQRAGFHVTTRKDLRLGEMKSAINDFGVRLNRDTIGLVYFAGHGVQTEDSRNYLLPIGADTDIIKSAQLPDGAVSLDFIRGAMDGGGLNLIFLDACRDNPYAFTRGSGKRGLAPMTSGSDDILIMPPLPAIPPTTATPTATTAPTPPASSNGWPNRYPSKSS
nr:caspase family protein [uncultured Cardiobacterium sp.]